MGDLIDRQEAHKWETCFECPLSYGCPKIKGCTNEQAIEYASQIPNDCPLSAQSERKTDGDTISRKAAIDKINERQRKLIYCLGFENDMVKIMDIAKSIITAIPSVQPEIIRCKDCKHKHVENMVWTCPFGLPGGENFFCGYGTEPYKGE